MLNSSIRHFATDVQQHQPQLSNMPKTGNTKNGVRGNGIGFVSNNYLTKLTKGGKAKAAARLEYWRKVVYGETPVTAPPTATPSADAQAFADTRSDGWTVVGK